MSSTSASTTSSGRRPPGSSSATASSPTTEAAGRDRRIESHLKDALGYRVDAFLRRPDALAKLAADEELADAEDQRFKPHVMLRRGRLSDSTIDASDPGALTGGRTSTMRTLGTLRRIVAKFG